MKSFLLALLFLMFGLASRVPAATISANGATLGLNSVPAAGIGTDGYVFYGTGGLGGPGVDLYTGLSPATPVSYVSIMGGNGTYGDSTYTNLTIAGTTVRTGVVYLNPVVQGSTGTLLTLTLQADVPSSFILSILEDNASAAANNMSAIRVNGSNSVTQLLGGNAGGVSNDFYSFLVSDAAPGNVITIDLTNNGRSDSQSHYVIGGLAFAPVPVPEPSTWFAGLGSSLCLLGFGARRFQQRKRD